MCLCKAPLRWHRKDNPGPKSDSTNWSESDLKREIGLSSGGHRTQVGLGSETSNHDTVMPGDHCYLVSPCFCPRCNFCTLYWFQIFSVLDTPLIMLPWFTLPWILGDILQTTWTPNKPSISQVINFLLQWRHQVPVANAYGHWVHPLTDLGDYIYRVLWLVLWKVKFMFCLNHNSGS